MTKWRCSVCGYVYEGNEPPDLCPKCRAPKSKFVILDETKNLYEEILDPKKNSLNTIVLEVTNKCDLNCIFYPSYNKNKEMDFNLFKRLIDENNKLENPVRSFELNGLGNPLLHSRIRNILKILHDNKHFTTIVTNGLNLKENISKIDSKYLEFAHFVIYLDAANREKNDKIMGKKAFDKTIKALKYLDEKNITFSLCMRATKFNYDEVEKLAELTEKFKCNLIVTEVFPRLSGNNSFLLTDKEKGIVLSKKTELERKGSYVNWGIQFLKTEENCNYLRLKKIFINVKGEISFCHYLSHLPETEIANIKGKKLMELIELNNFARMGLHKRKKSELNSIDFERKTASPCSYCFYCFTK